MKTFVDHLIDYIEQIEPRNEEWTKYAEFRANEVRVKITNLRIFANKRPESSIFSLCHKLANEYEQRLNKAMEKF